MSDTRSAEVQPRTAAERVALTIAGLILAVVIGLIVFLSITSEHTPPRFDVTRGQLRAEKGVFYLPVTVTNQGDETASQVTLEGSLMVDGTEESASTTFDFIPGHSEVEAVLIFRADPQDATIGVVSYQKP
jgi:uncharacterized protein (TIGR02588 family)